MIELILLESVPGLGRPGDQVQVKPGFARNFLLPLGKAAPVSTDVLRGLDKLRAKAEEEEREAVRNYSDLSTKMKGFEVEIRARATDDGHLFGSVTDRDVQEALEAASWQLPARCVRLEEHIKEHGKAEVSIHLYGDISTTVIVDVVPVDADDQRIEILEASQPQETPDESDDSDRRAPRDADY